MADNENKSLWGSVKSLLVEEVPDNSSSPIKEEPAQQEATATKPDPVTYIKVDPQNNPVLKQLKEAVLSSSPKTWKEFSEQLSTLRAVIDDESTAYKAAIAVLGKSGVGYDQLLVDASTCIDVLEGKKQEFEREFELQLNKRVLSKQKSVENLDDKIKALQIEISNLSNERSEAISAITEEKQQISEMQNKFIAAYNFLYKELNEEKSKITIHGKK